MTTRKVVINTRILHSPLTGMQRYILELISRIGNEVETVSPRQSLSRTRGNAWEQFILPMKVGRRILFSPANTGPLAVTNQVVTIHDVAQLDRSGSVPELNEDIDSKAGAWYRFLTPRLVRRVAHVITDSEFSKQRLLANTKLDEAHVTVIHLGVDPSFQPVSQEEAWTRLNNLSLPSQHYVLCVGSLEPRKNISRLLQAWSRIQTYVPDDIWLVLTGKKGNARNFADDAGLSQLPPRVHLTGHVADEILPSLYAGALAFAFPSVYEGFGLPPLEAMASGVPVLTGNRASLPEVVGNAGLMVDPYNVDALAEGLLSLVNDENLRKELSAKGLKRAKQFSWDMTTARTLDILHGVA